MTSSNKEELIAGAAHCGLDLEPAELATGGWLNVLKKSKELDDGAFDKIVDCIDGKDLLKAYQNAEFKSSLPNPMTMLLPRPDFAPPGPPPWVIGKKIHKAVKKARRADKDAGNTQDTVKFLKKKGLEEESIINYLEMFNLFVQEKLKIDLSDVLCLPVWESDK